MKRSLSDISAIAFCSLMLCSCGEKKKEAPNPATMATPVNLYQVVPEKAVYYDRFPGTVVATMQVDIHAEVEGYVTAIFFKEGDHVKKGQKLYAIDDSKYRASYSQAQAGVTEALSNQDQAQKDADRYNYLNAHDAVAKQTVDHAMTTLSNAKNEVSSARQGLIKAQTDLNYSIIRAPFDGTIGISQVRLGTTVSAGQTLLNTISSDDPMAVDFVINENMIPRVARLKQQKPNPADSIFTLMLPGSVHYEQPGSIYTMDRGVNPLTGTITVRLIFPNPINILRTGMSCDVRIKSEDTAQQILIPSRAIVEQMGEYFVFIAKDTLIPVADTAKHKKDKAGEDKQQGPQLHALQRKVQLGPTIADKVIVRTGLQSGDSVIVDGVQRLRDGGLVTTANGGQQGGGDKKTGQAGSSGQGGQGGKSGQGGNQ